MRRAWILAGIAGFSFAVSGCGSSSPDEQASGTAGTEKVAVPTVQSDGRTPQEVVQIFMDAMVAHDEA